MKKKTLLFLVFIATAVCMQAQDIGEDSVDNQCYPVSEIYNFHCDAQSITIKWIDNLNTEVISYTVSYWLDGTTDVVTVLVDTVIFTATGLEPMSFYHFSVTPNCPMGDAEAREGTFTTLCANAGCDITVAMTNRYGDGWPDNAWIDFRQNGYLMGTARLLQGNIDTVTVHVCSGAPLTFRWRGGNQDYRCGYVIYDGEMNEVYNSATGGVNHRDTIAAPCPSCGHVTGLVVDSVYGNDISISWNDCNPAAGYAIYLDGEIVDWISDTTYVYTNLKQNSIYSLGVRAFCSWEDSSHLSNVWAYSDCGELELPFFDDFEKYPNNSWMPCWRWSSSHVDYPRVGTRYSCSGSRSIILNAENDTLIFCTPSPIPTSGNNIYVRYNAYLDPLSYYPLGIKWLKGGVMTDPSDLSTFIVLDSIDGRNDMEGFEMRDFNTHNLDTTATYWVAWMYYSIDEHYGYGNDLGAIDDIYISEIPSCLHVESIGADSVTDESITLTWVNNEFNTQPDYTVRCWPDTGDTIIVMTNDTFCVFQGLEENTLYNFSVTVNCDENQVVTARFRTHCTPFTIPYVEGFEGQTIRETPRCWNSLIGEAEVRTDNPHSGNNRLNFICWPDYDRAPYGTPPVLMLPPLSEEVNRLQMTFWTRPFICDTNYYCGSLSVGYLTDPNDGNSFTALETYNNNDFYNVTHDTIIYKKKTVLFVDVPDGVRMAFRQNTEDAYAFWYIDDIEVNMLSGCLPVKKLLVSNVTDTGAVISWIPREGQSRWLVKIDSMVYVVTDSTISLTGLSPNTPYTVYVATDCNGDTSIWKSINFKTPCTIGAEDVTLYIFSRGRRSYNVASVNFFQNGILVGSAAMGDEKNDTAKVSVCCGIPVEFRWDGGLYNYSDYDFSYIVYDGNMGEIYNSANGGVGHVGYIKDVCSDCNVPARVRVTAVDSTSISIAWDTSDSVYGYIVSIDDGRREVVCFDGNYTFTGLAVGREYTINVMTLCDETERSNAVILCKSTTCGAMQIPLKEGFEDTDYMSIPECWYVMSYYPRVRSYANYHSGYNSLELPAGSMIATPLIPLPGDMIRVSFWAATTDNDTMEVGVMTNLGDIGTFVPMVSIIGTNDECLHFEFDTKTLPHDNSYYVVFRGIGYGYIDDVEVFEDASVAHYTVNVSVNDTAMGSVTGEGRYVEGYIATFTATAKPGFRFEEWYCDICTIDSVSATNPVLSIPIIGDMNLEARFAESVGIGDVENSKSKIEIVPNPATECVDVLSSLGVSRVEVYSAAGLKAMDLKAEGYKATLDISHLPSGTYLLRIHTPQGITTKKLMKK